MRGMRRMRGMRGMRGMSTGLRKFSVKKFFLLKNPQKVVLNPFQPKKFFGPTKNFSEKT